MKDTASPAPSSPREAATTSVRGAALWSMAGQYLSFAIQFIVSALISRFLLSPAEVGLFSIALSMALMVSVLQDFGLSRYISGLPRLDDEEKARCASVALLFSLGIAVILIACAVPMARFYHLPALRPLLLIMAASYVFQPLSVVPMALMARSMAFRGHFVVNVGAALIHGAVALGMAAAGFSAFSLAWATLASAIARGAIAQFLRPVAPWPLRLSGIRPILGSGTKLSALYATGSLGTRTPDIIIGKLLGIVAVGLYSRAISMVDQFRMLIAGAIGGVFFPAFARIRDRGEPLGPAYLRVVAGYTAIIWPGMLGLALAAHPLVLLLFGEHWLGVAPPLSLIAVSVIFLIAIPLNTDLPILLGQVNRLIALNLVDTALALAMLVAGCRWGVQGAAWGRVAYAVIWLAMYAPFLWRIVGFAMRDLLAIYARSAAAAMAAALPLALTYLFWISPEQIGLLLLLVDVGLGIALWLATLALVRHPALDEILALVRHLVQALPRPARKLVRADA